MLLMLGLTDPFRDIFPVLGTLVADFVRVSLSPSAVTGFSGSTREQNIHHKYCDPYTLQCLVSRIHSPPKKKMVCITLKYRTL